MSDTEHEALIRRCIEGLNQGNLEVISQTVAKSFFNYEPAPGEETADQVMRRLTGDLLIAFPDMTLEVNNFRKKGDDLSFTLSVSGTQNGNLWGYPGTGNQAEWTSTVTSRTKGGRFAFCWEELSLPETMAVLRSIGMVPPPEDMDKPTKHPVSIPEFLLKLLFTGQAADLSCEHLDLIKVTDTDVDVCNQCVAQGDIWPALRMCLICGFVGCCDTSKNKHMKQHYEQTGHMIFRSIRLQESWVWCYEDDRFFAGKVLDQFR